MLKKLQAKWGVGGWRLLLIFCTFALGGSLCGLAGRKLLAFTGLEKNVAWFFLYIITITILWPLCVLLISIPLGQFSFFRRYIGKIFKRFSFSRSLRAKTEGITNIAIFASGAGSNAKRIISHFRDNSAVRIKLIVTNRQKAGVVQIAREHNIELMFLTKDSLDNSTGLVEELKKREIRLIVLAGFLLKIPAALIRNFPNSIINIHPALLPGYGGTGMYGRYVHEAVIKNKETKSGITIHHVDEIYDHGTTIFQATCNITETDTVETLAQKVQVLEQEHYATVIENFIKAKTALKTG